MFEALYGSIKYTKKLDLIIIPLKIIYKDFGNGNEAAGAYHYNGGGVKNYFNRSGGINEALKLMGHAQLKYGI